MMDDLVVPFMFVPDGAAPDEDWLARYPNWVKFPATLVWRYVGEGAQKAELFEPDGSTANPDGIADDWHGKAEAEPGATAAQSKRNGAGAALLLPSSSQSDTRAIEVVRWTSDVDEAARGLGMSRRAIGRAIHRLKNGLGLRGDDNLLIEIPSGDVYFNGENVGNLGDE